MLIFDLINEVIIDQGIIGKLCDIIRKKYIYKISKLRVNIYGSIMYQ